MTPHQNRKLTPKELASLLGASEVRLGAYAVFVDWPEGAGEHDAARGAERRRAKAARRTDEVMADILEDQSLCIIREALERHFHEELDREAVERRAEGA